MKAIIFDMDGLMVDTERLYFAAEKELAHIFGREVEESTLFRMMGRKPLESMMIFSQELKLDVDPEYLLARRNEIMRQKLRHDLKPMPGLYTIINLFFRRLKLAIATGAQQEFLDLVVSNLGLASKFAVLQASDEIKKGKPAPEIYLLTAAKLGLLPEECIVLEDSANGVLAGHRAGCYVIAIPSVYCQEQDFSPANVVLPDLFAATAYIENLLSKKPGGLT
ncbi:MAG: HAD family hydrolase [Candidatus Aminicenantales bacterium]